MLTRRSHLGLIATFGLALGIVISLPGGPAYAADGDLDTTFGTGGKVTTDFLGGPDSARAVAIQPDGKIVTAGTTQVGGTNFNFALARYNPNGDLDTTFGSGGKVSTDFNGDDDGAYDVAIQPDGKIVAAGTARNLGGSDYDFGIARYNTNGTLDTTFSGDGRAVVIFTGSSTDVAYGVAVQPDGKIVTAGQSTDSGMSTVALARLNSDGNPNSGFDGDGQVVTNLGGSSDQARAIALQPAGRIVAAGFTDAAGTNDFALLRFNSNGSLDATFGSGGTVVTDFSFGDDKAYSVVIQPDGTIVAAGQASIGGNTMFALSRYDATGSLDPVFDGDGKVTTDFVGNIDKATSVATQQDGKIVAAGSTTAGSADFALARYNSTGGLDTTFGTGGKITTNFNGGPDMANDLAMQSDGKIVAAGYSNSGSDDFAVARYLSTNPPTPTPTSTTAPTGTPYPLFGDKVNNGSGYTEFRTTYGNWEGSWAFYSDSNTQDVTALRGQAINSNTGTGVMGMGGRYGVYGSATANGGAGIYGRAGGSTGAGVIGESSNGSGVVGTSNIGIGVYGRSENFHGVLGESTNDIGVVGTSRNSYGIYGLSFSVSNDGVYGEATGSGAGVHGEQSGAGPGVLGRSLGNGAGVYGYHGTTGYGIYGYSERGNGVTGFNRTDYGYGIYGYSNGNRAGYFAGNVRITGTLSKGAGSFKIDDPIDPENKYLYHSFVESSDMMNIYNGNVTTDAKGEAVVTLPDWFEALNRDFRYQLTPVGQFAQAMVANKVKDNRFTIKTDKPNVEVSWQVTGVRKDPYANAHRIPVEEDKPADEKGKYLHPTEWGKPETMGVDYEEVQKIEQMGQDAQELKKPSPEKSVP